MDWRRRALVAGMVSTPWTLACARQVHERAATTRHIIHGGPRRKIRRIADAARLARDGDIVEVDAGDYVADTAVWDRSHLIIRSTGGASRLIAGGASADGKAIWVVRGDRISIRNFHFTGARVASRNGAGIRHESGHLQVIDCAFVDNEDGLLAGNNGEAELTIERCEFGHNGGRAKPQPLRRQHRPALGYGKLFPPCTRRTSAQESGEGEFHPVQPAEDEEGGSASYENTFALCEAARYTTGHTARARFNRSRSDQYSGCSCRPLHDGLDT